MEEKVSQFLRRYADVIPPVYFTYNGPIENKPGMVAAQTLNLTMLMDAIDNGFTIIPEVCATIARCGRLDMLIWAHENGLSWTADCALEAVRSGNLEVVKYVINNGCKMHPEMVYLSIRLNDVPMIKLLLVSPVIRMKDELGWAFLHGTSEVLKIFLKDGGDITCKTIAFGIIRMHHMPENKPALGDTQAERYKKKVWQKERETFARELLRIVKKIKNKTYEVYIPLIEINNMKGIKYIYGHGFPLHENLFIEAVKYNNSDVFKWLLTYLPPKCDIYALVLAIFNGSDEMIHRLTSMEMAWDDRLLPMLCTRGISAAYFQQALEGFCMHRPEILEVDFKQLHQIAIDKKNYDVAHFINLIADDFHNIAILNIFHLD